LRNILYKGNKYVLLPEDLGAPKKTGPVAIATFATIVNPAPLLGRNSLR